MDLVKFDGFKVWFFMEVLAGKPSINGGLMEIEWRYHGIFLGY